MTIGRPNHLQRATCNGKRAFTLVEVMVVLALLGLMAGISGLALASLDQPRESEAVRALRAARAEAIRTGRPRRVTVTSHDTGSNRAPRTAYLFLPDGRGIGPGVDPLTGDIRGRQ
jgi:prepilin-type N-terminal cleavage/methylation domain-containing protein